MHVLVFLVEKKNTVVVVGKDASQIPSPTQILEILRAAFGVAE